MAVTPRHALGLLPGIVLAATFACRAESAPLFAGDEIIDVTVTAPLTTLMNERSNDTELEGSFAWTDPGGAQKRVDVKLRTRGNYRRAKHHCDFAPIRLNFSKGAVAGTAFDGQDKLKLVTHCRTWEREFKSIVLREYLTYRLFRVLTDVGYDVRLLRITYQNAESKNTYTRFGFVIEDSRAMARRNDLKYARQKRLSHQDHDRARQNLVHVFQYMIGNTEYSLVNPEPDKNCCHNADILSVDREPPYIAVPYDFDFAGLVDAPYAQPNPKYPINRVRTRFYKGHCANNDVLPDTLALFRERRADIFRIVGELEALSSAGKSAARPARDYIEDFYEIVDDPEAVEKHLVARCQAHAAGQDAPGDS